MNWKIGQKLVVVKHIDHGVPNQRFPNKDEVVTFDGLDASGVFVYLIEYNYLNNVGVRIGWKTRCFRPLLGQSATAELVSSFIEITETSDLPIRSPQTETV